MLLQREMPRAGCLTQGDGATETLSTRRRDATRHNAGQQKYCAPYKCPKEKEAVQNRLSFKAKKGGCDALNSGAGMQMRGTGVRTRKPRAVELLRRAAPCSRQHAVTSARERPVAFSRGRIKARTAHAERRGGTSTPQVQCQTVRADAHRRVLRPAPGLRLDLRHVDEIL